MTLYRYVKAPPEVPIDPVARKRKKTVASLTLMTVGGGILLWVLWPILSFTFVTEDLFIKTVTPVADASMSVRSANSLSPIVLAANGTVESASDFTNANVWYPTAPQKKVVTPVNTYMITIPKLHIADALVTISGDDLNSSLVHYGGTGLPGQYGNAVIFGHSTLPQFYNPKNYKTIFSTLPTLKMGDEILITYDGVKYRYTVFDIIVNEPNDVSTLEQRFDDSYITLVTCVPPGTYWKRLNVRAKLSNV